MRIQLKRSELNRFWFVALTIIFSLCLFVVIIYTGYTQVINNVIAIASVVISLYFCYIYRFNIGMLIAMLMVLYTNYSIAIGVYLFPEIRPASLYSQFSKVETYGVTIMCIFLFEVVLLFLNYRVIKEPKMVDVQSTTFFDNRENNSIICYGGLGLYCLMFFLTFELGTGVSGRATTTAITEYRVVCEIISLYYSGKRKSIKYIWTVVVAITTVFTFIGGNRISTFATVAVLIMFCYSNFFTYKKVLMLVPVGVIVLAGIGFMRTNFSLSYEAINQTLQMLFEDKLTNEGAIFGYVPSLAVTEITDSIPLEEKIGLLIEHIKEMLIFVPTDNIKSNLGSYARNYFLHYAGFISPTYFYFWFKYFGAILFALLVNMYMKMYIKMTNKKINGYFEKMKYIISIFFISCTGRWYCYGPTYLFKSMLICCLVYTVVYFFENILKGKSRAKN